MATAQVNTSAKTEVPKDMPVPWSSENLGTGSIFTVAPFVLYFLSRSVVRRFIRDRTEIAKDRAETDIVQVLREDNAKLRSTLDLVQAERNQAVSQLGKFMAESELNKSRIEELQNSISTMSRKLEEQTAMLQNVLIENSTLKSQVQHLAEINEKLDVEVTQLSNIVKRMSSLNEETAKIPQQQPQPQQPPTT